MPVENPTIIIKDDEECSGDGNTVANNPQALTRHTHWLRSLHRPAHSRQSAVSNQVPIRHQTRESRKRNYAESEDELAASAKHPKNRTFSAAEVENWETVLIEESSRINPEAVRGLLNTGRSEMKRQRSRIANLITIIEREREVHQGFEKHQNEKYAALEKDFRVLRGQMASILTANVEAFSLKVSDDTIAGEWHQLYYKVQNVVSNYLGAATDRMTSMSNIIIRRRLWELICFHCFSGHMGHWYETIGQILARRIDQIDPQTLPSCQYLKMISNMKSAFDPELKEGERLSDSSEEIQAIIDAMPCFKDNMPPEQEVFKRDLGEIIKQAANLHLAMMKSKAIFVVKWAGNYNGEGDCMYDPETMISLQDGIDTTSSSYVVDMAESPAVWKIGNADGENFDSATVLCKSMVVVKEKKRAVLTMCRTN